MADSNRYDFSTSKIRRSASTRVSNNGPPATPSQRLKRSRSTNNVNRNTRFLRHLRCNADGSRRERRLHKREAALARRKRRLVEEMARCARRSERVAARNKRVSQLEREQQQAEREREREEKERLLDMDYEASRARARDDEDKEDRKDARYLSHEVAVYNNQYASAVGLEVEAMDIDDPEAEDEDDMYDTEDDEHDGEGGEEERI